MKYAIHTDTKFGPLTLTRQGILVPRGVVHRTRANERTVVLMFEAATVEPTGD